MLASLVAAGALVAGGGYVTADVYDVAPGILTLDRPRPLPTPTVSGTPAPVLLPTPARRAADPLLLATGDEAPLPTAAGLGRVVGAASDDKDLTGALGVVVADAVTGAELWSLDGDVPRVPASTVKLLSALAVVDSLDLDGRMRTAVLAPRGSHDLVLAARGDALLAPGPGNPDAVLGHAGLGDLAAQVADRLGGRGGGPYRLRLDLSWAPGPRYPATWDRNDVGRFYARPVAMTGLATALGDEDHSPSLTPEQDVAEAFAARLREHGVDVTVQSPSTWTQPVAEGDEELGAVESATYAQVLEHALDTSDNTLTEDLVRQAAATTGRPTRPAGANAAFVRERLEAHAVPTDGLVITDACGLSPGQRATPRTLAAVLALAVTDQVAPLRRLVAALPVAGLTGTLSDRFEERGAVGVAGVPRAKTGTLVTGSGLAGTTVDADGRPLTFVVLADGFPRTYDGIIRARRALDRIVAAVTRCGCR